MQFGPKINSVSKSGLTSMGRTVNVLRNIYFDPRFFQTTNVGNGFNITYVGQSGDTFPWEKLLYGYKISGQDVTIYAGEIHYRDVIYDVPETTVTIGADLTYVYVEWEWGTANTSIKQTTDRAVATASSQAYRKWLYLFNYTAPSTVTLKTIGNMGGIDVMPVFG